MPATRLLQLTYHRPIGGAKPASMGLVPLMEATQPISSVPPVPSPDPTFVTQLIANAQQLTERRRWPRDRAADALSAYACQRRPIGAELKTRQTI
jgi:hypothetical protein